MCDGKHTHAPWRSTKIEGTLVATERERNHEELLCRRIATLVAEAYNIEKPFEAEFLDRVHLMSQPRRGMKELINEYRSTVEVRCSMAELDVFKSWQKTKTAEICWKGIRYLHGAKLISFLMDGDGGLNNCLATIGLPWSDEEFLKEAEKLVHFFDTPIRPPPAVANTLRGLASRSPEEIIEARKLTLQKYTLLAAELAHEEKVLHSKLNPDVERVVKNKRVLLFKRMLQDISYRKLCATDLVIGKPLCGHHLQHPLVQTKLITD